MAFFGMYPSKYIGGNPYGFNGLYGFGAPSFFSGAHPSSINNGGINYFNGNIQGAQNVQTAAPIQNSQNLAPNNNVQAPIQDTYKPQTMNAQVQNLQNTLNNAKNEQGVIGKAWDGIKGLTGLGLSEKKCQKYINNVQNGTMSYDEAFSKISKYSGKQKSGVNLITGISTGAITAAALGFAPLTGGASILAAAGIGAAAKAGLKTVDRATNNIQNDAFNIKQIAKDGLSGALDGAVSSATIGIGKEAVLSATTAKEAMKQGAIAGAKGGAISGAAIGAGDYSIDCAFGDQKFEADDLIVNTAYGAIAGAATGAVIGGIQGKKAFKPQNDGKNPPPVSDSPEPKAPTAEEPKVEPKAAEPTPTPAAEEPKVEPKAAEPTPTPAAEEPKVEPKAAEPTPTPAAEEPKVEPKVEPKAAEPTPTPAAEEPKVEPKAAEPTPTPAAEEPKVEPKAAEPTPTPAAEEPKVEPKAAEPTPTPAAEEPKVEPKAAEPTPTPAAEEPKVEADPLKENIASFVSGKKAGVAPQDAASDNLKGNAAKVITDKKLGTLAKLKGFFGFES